MGRGVEARFCAWVDLIGDVLRTGPAEMPVEPLLDAFRADFDARASWNWSEPDGSFGFCLDEVISGWPDASEMEAWGQVLSAHPLIDWFATTGDTTAMTLGRVPLRFGRPGARELVLDHLQTVSLDQQLGMPYRLGEGHMRSIVLATTGTDFGDDDVDLARRLQPLLVLLARQSVVATSSPGFAVARATFGLTARESAVLQLLGRGLTARAIAHHLGISPRTVHVHLGRVYRKLSVGDRLCAVNVARRAGAISPEAAPTEPPATIPVDRRFSWSPSSGFGHLASAS
jgi:DNA-binding CsgD family transcriptional regulator